MSKMEFLNPQKAENKAKAQHSWGLGFPELGKIWTEIFPKYCEEVILKVNNEN